MTDKVQKIREEVEKLHGNPYYMIAVKDVLAIIDSLQEESVPKIFEDMLNAKTPAESLGISAEEHEKIIDLCLYGKEPEMVDIDNLPKEEPVSDELEEAMQHNAPDNIGIDDLLYWRNGFIAGAKWQIKQLKRGVFIPGAKSVEFKLGEDYHISTKDFDRGKAKAYGAKEGDKIIAYFFIMDSGI